MKLPKLLATFIICPLIYANYTELPAPPNMEELCEHSKIVVCAEPTKQEGRTHTIGLFKKTKYRVITFKVHKVYKGSRNIKETKTLIPTERSWGCAHIPIYKTGEKYLLFLGKRRFRKLYMRAKIDDIWGERKWSKDKEKQLIKELKFLSDPDRWKKPGDNLSYTIPKDANEKSVELTEYQKKRKFSKRAEYWLRGKLVGERAWYGNGQIAYETPFKNDMRHGVAKGWYPNGKPFEVRPYRKDRLHGILTQWDKNGKLTIGCWIRGKNVAKAAYLKASKTNATLPKYQAKESEESRNAENK